MILSPRTFTKKKKKDKPTNLKVKKSTLKSHQILDQSALKSGWTGSGSRLPVNIIFPSSLTPNRNQTAANQR